VSARRTPGYLQHEKEGRNQNSTQQELPKHLTVIFFSQDAMKWLYQRYSSKVLL
jgi:hypothetical protein